MEVGFIAAERYLEAVLSGDYSLLGMLEAIDRIAERVAALAAKRVLVDASSIACEASLGHKYVYASHAAVALRGVWRCAAYGAPHRPVVPFTSLVAKGKGLVLDVFRHRADAVSWLLSR